MIPLHDVDHPSIEGFWAFIEEREAIRIHRLDGVPRPWTGDGILHNYRFCNVRREHDYGTRWFVERAKYWFGSDLLWRTVLYRMVNNVSWFDRFGDMGVFGMFDWDDNRQELVKLIHEPPPPSSPAYLILAAPNKDSRATRLVRYLEKNRIRLPYVATHIKEAHSLEVVWKHLQEFDGVGVFNAMQIYRDLILLGRMGTFTDNDFAYMGPGAQYTLERLGAKTYAAQAALCRQMFEDQPGWRLSLCDVQHSLCEYGKWLRIRAGTGKRRKFTPRKEPIYA